MKFLESLVEWVYWTEIFLFPTLILVFAGYVIDYNFGGIIGLSFFIGLSALGIGLGIYFAEKIRRTMSCVTFMVKLRKLIYPGRINNIQPYNKNKVK